MSDARQRELLERIHRQSGLLSQMVNELLDLARIEARAGTGVSLDFRLGSQPLTANEEFHLLQIVREALNNVQPSGPAATWRSPALRAVTVSLIERPICGLFFSSLSKNDQP